MNEHICPYCRTEMEDASAVVRCPVCSTPHHRECWEENGGCTVFGCEATPIEEAKVVVSGHELGRPDMYPVFAASDTTGVPPPPATSGLSGSGMFNSTNPMGNALSILGFSEPEVHGFSLTGIELTGHTDRRTYTLLGFFFGYLGVHNLYANRMSVGIIQLCVTVFTCFLAAPIVWIWALVEICTLDRDGDGLPMI
ncbi:MAG: NINE protein [Bryobacterales bacterium]|nr:NINE protein [Bryobacterales bacterium]